MAIGSDLMKKIIVISLIIFVMLIVPVSARAGGGSSGGSSGGSGSSSHHHDNSRSDGYTYPGATLIPIIGMLGIVYYTRHEKIRRMRKQVKRQLNDAYNQDEFWNEDELKKKVKGAYYRIQEAWSQQDLEA